MGNQIRKIGLRCDKVRERSRSVVILLCLLFGLTQTPRKSAVLSLSPIDDLRLGVNMHPLQDIYAPDEIETQIDLARRLGVQIVRIDIHWAWIEPVGPGVDNWNPSQVARLETFLDAIADSGIEVLATVTETPCWASTDPTKQCASFSYDWRYPPADAQDYASFLSELVARYGAQIGYWEIWNEPNLPSYWFQPDPAVYTELLKVAYPAVKATDPNAIVIGGALGPWDGSTEYPQDTVAYLEGMYAAGAMGTFDSLSYHPYTDGHSPTWYDARWPMHSFSHSVPALQDCMEEHGDLSSLWITEVGWTTVPSASCVDCWTPSLPTTEAEQSNYLSETIDVAAGLDNVEALVWYELVDMVLPPDPNVDSFDDYFGLYRKDYRPKPAASEFRDIALPCRVFAPLVIRSER
jgi:hypothetical protein